MVVVERGGIRRAAAFERGAEQLDASALTNSTASTNAPAGGRRPLAIPDSLPDPAPESAGANAAVIAASNCQKNTSECGPRKRAVRVDGTGRTGESQCVPPAADVHVERASTDHRQPASERPGSEEKLRQSRTK